MRNRLRQRQGEIETGGQKCRVLSDYYTHSQKTTAAENYSLYQAQPVCIYPGQQMVSQATVDERQVVDDGDGDTFGSACHLYRPIYIIIIGEISA